MGSDAYLHYLDVVITDDNRARRKSTEPITSNDDSIVVIMMCALTCMFVYTAVVFIRKCTR